MKTVISGRITRAILDDADLIGGITPSSFIHNGQSHNSAPKGFEVDVQPTCPMLPGETGEKQRDWTMCLGADAVIVADGNEHLAHCGRRLNLPVYET